MIKIFFSDIDGTLTDSNIYYSSNGEELKKFSLRDGLGFSLLSQKNILTGVITSEVSDINIARFKKKLNLDYILQGFYGDSKLEQIIKLTKKLNFSMNEVAYIGDDINCYSLLKKVGISGCPNDAHTSIKNIKNIYICENKGGKGCVREFIDYLLKK